MMCRHARSLTVDVVSDVVCPWCFSARSGWTGRSPRSPTSMSMCAGGRSSSTRPSRPKARTARRYMLAKFGSEERMRQTHARLEALGEAEGIDFAFDAIKVSPNTLDAHRVIRWAGAAGADVQNRLVRRLFQLYFEEGAEYRRPCGAGRSGARSRHGRGGRRDPARHRRRPRRGGAAKSRPHSAWASPACRASCSKANTRSWARRKLRRSPTPSARSPRPRRAVNWRRSAEGPLLAAVFGSETFEDRYSLVGSVGGYEQMVVEVA